ncbi:diacylglycerol kinase family protein [Streptomyces sp. 5.8]|uniref:diacylglycerol kinase family protein n=1 Tax=Streptomyces sp. 5.8 TaxID=3406571 RepID=UPI003BB5BDA4
MSAEITLFVNPTAGSGRAAHAAQPAASALRGAGFSVRTVVGGDAPDALARLRTAVREGTGAVIAVGGDGMVSLALQALAGTLVPLGVVAVGTGNDFARAMGLPVREPARAGRLAAEALKEGRFREIDLGRVDGAGAGAAGGGTWYGTVLCSGFDSGEGDGLSGWRPPAHHSGAPLSRSPFRCRVP